MRAAQCDAVLFDLDGVLTDTAAVHEQAWEQLFNEVFDALAHEVGELAPYTSADYFRYIDGKPRTAGIRAMLTARGIQLPDGSPQDSDEMLTVHGLGNRKNQVFLRRVREHGVRRHDGAEEILEWLELQAIPKAVVSSSRNADVVLRAAGLRHYIDVLIDGVVTTLLDLPGKPAPDPFLYAARQLQAEPVRTLVVEDATSGAAAGRSGGFWVVGVDHGAGRDELFASGAHRVVDGLDEIFFDERRSATPVPSGPVGL